MAQRPVVGHTLLIIAASGSHSDTPQESSGRQISPTQRPTWQHTPHTRLTDIYSTGRIRNR